MVEYDCKCSSPGEYGTTRNETPATCTEAGWYEEICVECGGLVSSGTIDAGHDWDSGTIISEANCVHGNITKYKCQRTG